MTRVVGAVALLAVLGRQQFSDFLPHPGGGEGTRRINGMARLRPCK
jgi:hypothetical protein